MRTSVEVSGVHGPSETLAQLRRDLQILQSTRTSEIQQGSSTTTGLRQNELVESSSICRVDAELVATQLQLNFEIQQLELAVSLDAETRKKLLERETFENNERTRREQVEQEFLVSLENLSAAAKKNLGTVNRAVYIRLCDEATAKRVGEFQSHEQQIKQMDEEEFRQDRDRIASEWKAREKVRRFVEQEERDRLAAIRQAAREDAPFVYNSLDMGLAL